MRLDSAAFPIVRMHYNASGDGHDLELFDQLLALEQPFVVLALSADSGDLQTGDESRQLSRWMKQHRKPLQHFLKAMVYVEQQPTRRFIANASARVFDMLWGYPLLVAASEAEALPAAERILAGLSPGSANLPQLEGTT